MNPLDEARNRQYPERCLKCWNFKEHCKCNPNPLTDRNVLVIVRHGMHTVCSHRKAAARWN